MKFPLILDLAADGIPVAVTCRTLGFSKQVFYPWRAHPVTDRDWADAHLIDAAMAIHADDPAFGNRFIAEKMPYHGITAGENRYDHRGPWESIDDLEIAAAEYVYWVNRRRLHGEIGLVAPAEYEDAHYRHHATPATAKAALPSLHCTRLETHSRSTPPEPAGTAAAHA